MLLGQQWRVTLIAVVVLVNLGDVLGDSEDGIFFNT